MPSHVETDEQPSVTQLVSGILHDAQDLARQQLTLFQVEIRNDMRRTVSAAIPLIAGLIVLFIGVIIVAMAAAYLLVYVWPSLDLWAAFGIVGGGLTLLGVALVLLSWAKFSTFNPLPEQTVEGLKENLQWKTKR